jgi:hypothetical protein
MCVCIHKYTHNTHIHTYTHRGQSLGCWLDTHMGSIRCHIQQCSHAPLLGMRKRDKRGRESEVGEEVGRQTECARALLRTSGCYTHMCVCNECMCVCVCVCVCVTSAFVCVCV